MATTTDLSVLKINYLTQAQYNTALSNNTVNPNELYLTPSATLTVGEGGTGNTSFTASRAIFSETASKLSSSSHFMNSTKLAINSTSEPSYNLYINGSTMHNGDIYQTSLNGQRWREHFYEATAGTSALGTGTQTFTVKGGRWGEVWFEYPRLTTTYATAGDASSTATTSTSASRYWWRQWSYNSSTADRLSYYESFYLPAVSVDRTANASYEIFTSKSYTTLDGRYVNVSGDTMTGDLTLKKTTTIASNAAATLNFQVVQSDNNITNGSCYIKAYDDGDANNYGSNMVIQSCGNMIIGAGESPSAVYSSAVHGKTANANITAGANASEFSETGENMIIASDGAIYFLTNANTVANRNLCFINSSGYLYATKVYGAVWNDYAEYRQTTKKLKPGRVVIEVGNGDMKLSDGRLQPGANVITDTFGFAIGKTKLNKTPIAVSGRVLAYPYESIDEFKKHIGGPVCSGPNGTVSIMSVQEERLYPSRIIGTVSEIPDYEEWGTNNIKVNGRIWIRIR